MIGRLLVPSNSRALSDSAPDNGQRRKTPLDLRTIIPADLPQMTLDAKSSIPAYMPLDVLSHRLVIPRDMPIAQLDLRQTTPSYVPLAVLGTPQAVPKDAKLPQIAARPVQLRHPAEMPELLEPDVITTGEVNLFPQTSNAFLEEKRWVLRGASAVLHAAAIALILVISTLIPTHTPTNEEIEMAARSLGELYLPPDMKTLRHQTPPPEINSPIVRIDPKEIRRLAPPEPLPGPPQPPISNQPPREMVQPSPTPGSNPQPNLPPPAPRIDAPSPTPHLEPVKPPTQPPTGGLTIPRYSPGRAIQQSLDDAARNGGGPTGVGFDGAVPRPGGGGGQEMAGGLTMLTPTEGVDFSSYLDRVLASVKRNWYSIIPESARMGEQGKVYIDFEIMRDGSVPPTEPTLLRTSGKDPLDRAALSSIRASSPFEPLPPAFGGPRIKLRFVFLYNLPLSAAQ
jgi:TonB family protein